jgi:PASTA domain
VRQIIGSGKLAVVIGLELDCIGNFYQPYGVIGGTMFNPEPSDDDIRAEIRRLFAAGVRYFFPVHLVDNVFGGCALYDMTFNVASFYQNAAWITPETAPATSEIDFRYDDPENFWEAVFDINTFPEGEIVLATFGFNKNGFPPPPPSPHRNSRGLQDRGRVALDELMRLGALIDVDHMGEKTVLDTLQHTAAINYPLFAGHNGIRSLPGGNERAHLRGVAVEILNRGGMYGAGIKDNPPLDGLQRVHNTILWLRSFAGAAANGGIGLGSDSSGLEQLPSPRNAGSVVYSDEPNAPAGALQRCFLGRRAEDINTSGFAHVGMYPDFIEEGVSSGILTGSDVTELFNAPERFAAAWQICLARRPVAYLTNFPGQGPMIRIVDRSTFIAPVDPGRTIGHIGELSYSGPPGWWAPADLTEAALTTWPPAAAGPPFGYLTSFAPDEGPTARVIYQAAPDDHIWELSYPGPPSQWGANDLTQLGAGPAAADTPHGYVTDLPGEGPRARVAYWGTDGHVWELAYTPGQNGGWAAHQLTKDGVAPPPAGRPFGYVTDFAGQGPLARVIYQGTDGHIWELNYPGQGAWGANDLTTIAGGQLASDLPFGYFTDLPGEGPRARVIYTSANGLIWELIYPGPAGQWTVHELTGPAGGQLAAAPPHGYLTYFTGSATARVVYQGTDGHIWELNYAGQDGLWGSEDLTGKAGGPLAAGPPFGYLADLLPNQGRIARVIYKSADGHTWELSYPGPTGDWWATDLSLPGTTVPDVVGKTQAEAGTAIAAAQLKMQVVEDSAPITDLSPAPIVEWTDPDAGTVVGVGSVVVVTVQGSGEPHEPPAEQPTT